MQKIKLKITTPERVVLEEEVDQISLPTQMGEITILPEHVPLISILSAGILETKKDGKVTPMAVSGGFLEFHRNEITILADTAETVDELDLERAELAARNRAEELKKKSKNSVDESAYTAMIYRIEKQLVRVKLAKKYKRRTPRKINLD